MSCGRHAGSGLLDDADKVVTWRERQWPLEVRVAAAPDEGIGEAGASSEHLDADLAGAGVGDGRLFRQFQDLGAAEPSDTDVLPRHAANIAMGSPFVALHVRCGQTGRSYGTALGLLHLDIRTLVGPISQSHFLTSE